MQGLSGSTLKLIAVVSMLIDHVGAGILGRMLILGVSAGVPMEGSLLYSVYSGMRLIGRIAFPIYIFLLIEGMQKTGNRRKYAIRLGIFALISEIPFDLAFHGKWLEFSYQNIFFTLFIGLLTIITIDRLGRLFTNTLMRLVLLVSVTALGAWIAESLHTDYGAIGILCIVVIYGFSYHKTLQLIAGSLVFLWEVTAPLAFIPIYYYNGKRGLKLKYTFYLFYPFHLLVIYLIARALGMAQIPAL